jgi:hypothetical protein
MVTIDTNKRTLGVFSPNTILKVIAVLGTLVLMFITTNFSSFATLRSFWN